LLDAGEFVFFYLYQSHFRKFKIEFLNLFLYISSMTKKEHVEYWLTTAQRDIQSMEHLFQTGEYHWSLFVGHLAIEKLLKALWVKNNESNTPPKTHNLLVIVDRSGIRLTDEERELLAEMKEFFDVHSRSIG